MRAAILATLGLLLAAAQDPDVHFSPFDDPEARALELLDQAQRTVDIAQYNIRSERFYEKLVELRARGVVVRIVVDAKNAARDYNTLDDRFEAEGFDIRRHENTRSNFAIMHHKFSVIDSTTVMTGSYNWNETAQVVNDENMLVLRDPALAAAYEAEFRELLGEAPEAPGPGFGQTATVYFSPEDRVRDAVLEQVRGAQRRIRVAMFTFTDTVVARALRDAARRGVEVTLLVEKKQADRTRADETVGEGGARVIVGANTASAFSAMHQKFAVIDDAVVITGACNWTYTAFRYSNEDLLVIRDPALARRYTQAFGSLVARYDPDGFDAAAYGIDRDEGAVHFVVRHPRTRFLERVYVVGDHPALGGWDLSRAIPLTTTETLFPSWAGRVRLPAGTRVEWKAVVLGPWGVTWETGENRVLETDPRGVDRALDVDFRDGRPPAGAANGLTGALSGDE